MRPNHVRSTPTARLSSTNLRKVIVAAFVLLVATQCALACPTCKLGLTSAEHQHMAQGYFWSILFMMSMPFFIFFGLGGYFYYLVQKAKTKQARMQHMESDNGFSPFGERAELEEVSV